MKKFNEDKQSCRTCIGCGQTDCRQWKRELKIPDEVSCQVLKGKYYANEDQIWQLLADRDYRRGRIKNENS